MNQQQHNDQQNQPLTMGQTMGIVLLFAHIWALPLEMIFRRQFGKRYIDVWVFAAAVWPPLFCSLFAANFNPVWSIVAFWLTLFLGALHRIAAGNKGRSQVHTQYSGYPRLCDCLPVSEETAKPFLEFLLAVALSMGAAFLSPTMSLYFFGGGFALLLKRSFADYVNEQEMDDLRDAMYEQQARGERFQQYR